MKIKNIVNDIGHRIKEMRQKKGLTQKELANLLGCAQTTIAEWERKNSRAPGKKLLGQVAEIFGVTTDYLLGKIDIEMPKVPCYGEFPSEEFIWPGIQDPTNFIPVPTKENLPSETCFGLKIMDDLLEPIAYQEDYCIFEKQQPKDGNIVIVRFPGKENRAMIRKWRQKRNAVMLLELNLQRHREPYFFEIMKREKSFQYKTKENEKIIVEGRLIAVKRVLKAVVAFPEINYIFS